MSGNEDPLVRLWQGDRSAGRAAGAVLREVHEFERARRRTNLALAGILGIVSILLFTAELPGRMGTHGLLSAVWNPVAAFSLWWRWRGRLRKVEELGEDTVSLLRRTLARARADLLIARSLYAGVPAGAALGALLTARGGGGSGSADAWLRVMLTGVGAAVLVSMIAAGVLLERSRRRQMRVLAGRLDALLRPEIL